MDKLDGKTSDIIKDNIQKLKELFPEVLTENKINFDILRQYLGDEVESNDKFYSFDWYGKEKAIQMAISQSTATLRPDKESSKDWDTTKNLFVEGDNLEVMRILRQTYREKVKMIYIDPPYNTGKDFVYTDNFKDNISNYKEKTNTQAQVNPETSGRYHTNWLNMMYPRLRMAKDLLRDDGVIFISIDDNEVHNLRKICDEIFGEENFVGQLVWENKEGGGSSDSRHFRIKHEYSIVYSKSKDQLKILGLPVEDADRYKLSDQYKKIRGKYQLIKLDSASLGYIKSLDYPISAPDGHQIFPNLNDKKISRWRWGKEKLKWGLENDFVVIKKDQNDKWGVYTKQYLNCDKDGNIVLRTIQPIGIISKYSTTQSNRLFRTLFGEAVFSYSKPTEYIGHLLKISTKDNDIILDFFAGSATTAHAVMAQNAEDGGNRKYIMVQLDEETDEKSEAYKEGYKTIAELARERIRRAGEKIIKDNTDKLDERESPLDIGFKAFYLDNTNMSKWDPKVNVEDLPLALSTIANTPIKSDRSEEDVLYEILLKYGIDITLPIVEHTISGVPVYTLGGNIMVICLSHQLTEDIIQGIADLEPEHIVVYDNAFPQDSDKLNAENIWNSLESKPKIKTI